MPILDSIREHWIITSIVVAGLIAITILIVWAVIAVNSSKSQSSVAVKPPSLQQTPSQTSAASTTPNNNSQSSLGVFGDNTMQPPMTLPPAKPPVLPPPVTLFGPPPPPPPVLPPPPQNDSLPSDFPAPQSFASPSGKKYYFYPRYESPAGDLFSDEQDARNIPVLMAKCDSRPACLGFNSSGWFKGQLQPMKSWVKWVGGFSDDGTYVKAQ